MKRRILHILRITVVPLALIALLLAGLTWRQVRHDWLNQQLIVALKKPDYPTALLALQQGADGRATDVAHDPRSFWRRFADLLRGRRRPSASHAPSALSLALDGFDPVQPELEIEPLRSVPEVTVVVRALLEHGADPNEREWRGFALWRAVRFGRTDMVKAFFDHGVRLDPHSSRARSLLFWAVDDNPDPGVTALLLDHSADVNKMTENGESLLTEAVCYSNPEIVKLLLDHGALIDGRNARGETALDCAMIQRTRLIRMGTTQQAIKSLDSVIALLKAHGATRRIGS